LTITVPFLLLFPQKNGSSYLENIPANFWGVAVRELPESVYAAIMHRAALSTILLDLPADQLNLPPIDQVAPESATITLLIAQRPKEDRAAAESLRTAPRRSKYSTALGKRGEEIALQYLRQTLSFHEAATLRWTASEGDLPGWDIEYTSSAGLNAIGVKASAGPAFPSIELSSNEWASAKRLGAAYRLMLVAQVRTTSPQIQIIENPAALIEQGRIVIEPVMWRLLMRET
jgi:Domain of unknown function (DUF3883)